MHKIPCILKRLQIIQTNFFPSLPPKFRALSHHPLCFRSILLSRRLRKVICVKNLGKGKIGHGRDAKKTPGVSRHAELPKADALP